MAFHQAQQILVEEAALRRETELRLQVKNPHAMFPNTNKWANTYIKGNNFARKPSYEAKKVCFSCGQRGHNSFDCPNEGKKMYYYKKLVLDHISKNCPERKPKVREADEQTTQLPNL